MTQLDVKVDEEEWKDVEGDTDNLAETIRRLEAAATPTTAFHPDTGLGRPSPAASEPVATLGATTKTERDTVSTLNHHEDDKSSAAQKDAVNGALLSRESSLRKFTKTLRPVRYPLSFLVVWMIGFLMAGVTILKPHCIIPGISDSPTCQPLYAGVDFPALIAAETKTVGHLESAYVGGSLLSLQIKRSEVAMRDLVTLVRISDLTAKDLLATTLMGFVHDAHKTGKGLQRLSSKFGGSLDNIITINEYALRLIESAQAPFSMSALISGRKPTKSVVTEAFESALHTISVNLERLILEAEASEKNLMDLEVTLSTLHEIVTQETSIISVKADKILWDLSTWLGGNRRDLRNLILLEDIGTDREDALGHVVAALQALRGMQQDIEDIRDRVAAPELVGRSVPVEVHISSLTMGLQRLKDGRLQAKTLEEKEVEEMLSKH